ncbi:MAG: matrixin family metalloprotease, partial [Candidatus Deferrimicrobiaceae bacterium]
MRTAARQIAWSALAMLFACLCAAPASAFVVRTTGTGAEIMWSAPSETYFVNPAGGPAGSVSAVTAAFESWTDVSTSSFAFLLGGTTTSDATGLRDGVNLVSFGSLESGSIAVTFTWYDTVTGKIADSDIRLNTNFSWSADGAPGSMDVQNIVTHESGHSLSLEDLYDSTDSEKTMYGFSSSGETEKRSLDPDDIAGITHLYPVPDVAITLSSPNGGEAWEQGSSHDILWIVSGDAGPTVRIELLKGGIVNGTIASSAQNNGSFAWNVSPFQTVGTDYRIRVASTSNGSVFDVSDGNLSIVSPPPPPPVVLTGLSISGPTSVPEGSTAPYTATASFNNGSTSPVTPVWSVSPTTFASIDAAGV